MLPGNRYYLVNLEPPQEWPQNPCSPYLGCIEEPAPNPSFFEHQSQLELLSGPFQGASEINIDPAYQLGSENGFEASSLKSAALEEEIKEVQKEIRSKDDMSYLVSSSSQRALSSSAFHTNSAALQSIWKNYVASLNAQQAHAASSMDVRAISGPKDLGQAESSAQDLPTRFEELKFEDCNNPLRDPRLIAPAASGVEEPSVRDFFESTAL